MKLRNKKWLATGVIGALLLGIGAHAIIAPTKLIAEACIGTQSKLLSYSEDVNHQGTITFKVPNSLRTGENKLIGLRLTYDGRQALYKIPEDQLKATISIPVVKEYDLDTVGTRTEWNKTVLDNILWETGSDTKEREATIRSFSVGGNLVVDAIIGKKDTAINNFAYANDPAMIKYLDYSSVADSPAKLAKLAPNVEADVFDQNVCVAPQTIWGKLTERYYQVDFDNKVMNPINDVKSNLLESHTPIPLYLNEPISEYLRPAEVVNSMLIGWDKRNDVDIGSEFEVSGEPQQSEPVMNIEDGTNLSYLMNYYYVIDKDKVQPSDENNQSQNSEGSK
ncbi:hypothetical protein ABGV42_00115 [Paenibacillus pabuli]|uniref:hypothetical protein n=1 Tax=Paenibacillus pabuli TaxID=1472 RepID=UPI003241BA40